VLCLADMKNKYDIINDIHKQLAIPKINYQNLFFEGCSVSFCNDVIGLYFNGCIKFRYDQKDKLIQILKQSHTAMAAVEDK